jgi:hypothetical protein
VKPYVIQYTVRAVVIAEDGNDAYSVAEGGWREIRGDAQPLIAVDGEVKSAESLPHGWDLRCLPYGGDGRTRLSELIEPTTTSAAAQAATKPLARCSAARDGDCTHPDCPQLRDNEPRATGRHCPLDTNSDED